METTKYYVAYVATTGGFTFCDKRVKVGKLIFEELLRCQVKEMTQETQKPQLNIPVVTCRFDLAWIGRCKNTADESGFCEKHKDIKCVSCGEQATHECSETMGLVCGAPLCDNCEHTIQDNGCNSQGKLPEGLEHHCKKSEQVYLPWYDRP